MIKKLATLFWKDSPKMLGRWNLKHKCFSEEIVVLNANRDNCGDTLCGNPYEYKKILVAKKQGTKKDS